MCNTKVAYFLASKIAKLVPVIIPTDCLKALSILTYVEVRRSVGINPNNVFQTLRILWVMLLDGTMSTESDRKEDWNEKGMLRARDIKFQLNILF